MVNDMKSGIGFLIPAAGVVGFFTSLLMGEFLVSIIIAVAGILIWFLYMAVMESQIPEHDYAVWHNVGHWYFYGIWCHTKYVGRN